MLPTIHLVVVVQFVSNHAAHLLRAQTHIHIAHIAVSIATRAFNIDTA